jgi:hypothetical protein
MQDFDLTDIDTSISDLLLAASEVDDMNIEHPPGFYVQNSTASTNTSAAAIN